MSLIQGYGDMNEYFKIPPLGQHYAIRLKINHLKGIF